MQHKSSVFFQIRFIGNVEILVALEFRLLCTLHATNFRFSSAPLSHAFTKWEGKFTKLIRGERKRLQIFTWRVCVEMRREFYSPVDSCACGTWSFQWDSHRLLRGKCCIFPPHTRRCRSILRKERESENQEDKIKALHAQDDLEATFNAHFD